MDGILLGIFFFICAAGLFLAGYIVHAAQAKIEDTERRVKELETSKNAEIETLKNRLSELETGKKTRNSYLTNSGLEDSVAVLLDAQQTIEYLAIRNKQAADILRQIRSDPGGYNEDLPNGKKNFNNFPAG